MKITATHVDFYMHKKYGWPRFSPAKKAQPCIHALINAQTKNKIDPNYDWHNLLNLIRLRRKHKLELTFYLRELYDNPGTIINPRKRAAYARRLHNRLIKEQNR